MLDTAVLAASLPQEPLPGGNGVSCVAWGLNNPGPGSERRLPILRPFAASFGFSPNVVWGWFSSFLQLPAELTILWLASFSYRSQSMTPSDIISDVEADDDDVVTTGHLLPAMEGFDPFSGTRANFFNRLFSVSPDEWLRIRATPPVFLEVSSGGGDASLLSFDAAAEDGGASLEVLFPVCGLLTLSRLGGLSPEGMVSGVGLEDLLQLLAVAIVLLAVLLMLDDDAVLLGGINEREELVVCCVLSFSSQSSVGLEMLRMLLLLLLLLLRRSFVFVVVVVAIFDVDFFSAILETFLVETAILPAEKDDEDEGRDEKETEDGIPSEQFSSDVVVLISLRFRPGFDGSFILVLASEGVVGRAGSPPPPPPTPGGRDWGFVPEHGAWRRDSIIGE